MEKKISRGSLTMMQLALPLIAENFFKTLVSSVVLGIAPTGAAGVAGASVFSTFVGCIVMFFRWRSKRWQSKSLV